MDRRISGGMDDHDREKVDTETKSKRIEMVEKFKGYTDQKKINGKIIHKQKKYS